MDNQNPQASQPQNQLALIDQFNVDGFVNDLTYRGFYNVPGMTPMHAAYLVVGEKKRLIMLDLERKELELQGLLLAPGTTITDIEATLAKYRKGSDAIVELRKKFTSFIEEKVTDPTRVYEKRVDPKVNPAYISLAQHLLQMKKDDEAKKQLLNNTNIERQQYIAHIHNQNTQIVSEYEQAVMRETIAMYNSYLQGQVENPDINAIKETVKSFTIRLPQRYPRVYLNDEEAQSIINTIPKVDFPSLQQKALEFIDQKFTTYQNDLIAVKSTPEALAQIEDHGEELIQEIANDRVIDQQINILAAGAAQTAPQYVPEGKAIKRKWRIVTQGTEEEHLKIIGAYIKTPECRKHIRVKNWLNLAIKQMADALSAHATETQIKLDELTYELDESL